MTRRIACVLVPLLLASLTGVAAAQTTSPTVAFGNKHGVALRDNGDVLTWGDNVMCQLGRATKGNTGPTPTVVMRNAKEIAVGPMHTLVLTADGTVYGWGGNGEGALGTGDGYDKCEGPVAIASLSGMKIAHIATGYYFSMAVTASGDLYCSGDNTMQQCPVAPKTFSVNRFTKVPFPELAGKVAQVKTGSFHTLVLTTDRKLYAFGRSNDGQLGASGTAARGLVAISALTDVVAFAAGTWHSVALRADGSAWAWGADNLSQLCDGTTTSRATPAKVEVPGSVSIAQIEAGGHATMLRTADGTVYACGDNREGQLGLGTEQTIPTPRAVPGISAQHIAVGGAHAAVAVDRCGVKLAGSTDFGVVTGTGPRAQAFVPRTDLSLCAAARPDLPAIVHEAPRGGESGCWTPRKEEDASVSPKFSGLRQAMLTAEGLLRSNAAWMAAPEPVRMRTSLSAGPSAESGARMHVKAVAERKRDGTRVWAAGTGCAVIPQVDRIGGAIAQVSVFLNTNSPFISASGEPPARTGTVAGFPEYNGWVLISKEGRVPWLPESLGEALQVETGRRERALAEWNESRARMKAPDPAWVQQTYEMLKKTDAPGAEKFLVSMKEQTAQFGARMAEFDAQTRKVEQQVSEARQYRASFTTAQLAMPAVLADPKAGDVSLTNLRPGDIAHARHVKADPAFPSASEPNRIQFIAVYFGQEADSAQTERKTWRERVVQTFDFNALAALVK